MEEERDMLTISEMSDRLKVKKSWLYRQTKRHGPGSIPRLKVGKYLRFNEAEVMAWLMENQKTNQD
jgi:excisionase family DNA binding protein